MTLNFPIWPLLCLFFSAASLQAAEAPDEKAQCTDQLKKIYQAIQQYRREHRALPNWLSDLTPAYISDQSIFACPVQRRTGRAQIFESLADPKVNTTYTYDFCARLIPADVWGGDGEMTMQTWKSLQMAVLGGKVPMLRCLNHGRAMNLGFDGNIWDSDLTWESAFGDVIDSSQLSPRSLAERFKVGRPDTAAGNVPSVTTPAESPEASQPARPASGEIPARDAHATVKQIDLSRFYNASLQESWHTGRPGNSLAKLPVGLQELDGTRFDVRGVVQLSGVPLSGADKTFPHQVSDIAVKLKTPQLHFLQGTGFIEADDVVLAQYVIHYADGLKETCPIIYGQTVRDWWYYPQTPKEAAQSHIAWTGNNQAVKSWNPPGAPPVTLRLYKTSWKNPHPDAEITTIDLVSEEKNSVPFLIAITAE
jgi:hypothetical protein